MRWGIAVPIAVSIMVGFMAAMPIIVAISGESRNFRERPAACAARWEPRATQYTPEAGCRVEFNGAFVPEKNVRFGE